mmetsp:Transcript_14907/g.63909  ORF Transcript_14907/g.63909 Transcript_14907/m.63909 type:complete len:276 (+) Transcript_14907:40-867(+)
MVSTRVFSLPCARLAPRHSPLRRRPGGLVFVVVFFFVAEQSACFLLHRSQSLKRFSIAPVLKRRRREVDHLERRRADRRTGEHEPGDRARFDVVSLTGRQAQPEVTLCFRRVAEDSNERVDDAARRLRRRLSVGGEEASMVFHAQVNLQVVAEPVVVASVFENARTVRGAQVVLHVVLEPADVAIVFEHARTVQEPRLIHGAPVEPELEQRCEKRVAERVFRLVVLVSSRRVPEQIEIVQGRVQEIDLRRRRGHVDGDLRVDCSLIRRPYIVARE